MIATLEGLSVCGVVSAIADADTATMVSARTIVICPLLVKRDASRRQRTGGVRSSRHFWQRSAKRM
jgi:hypothetical protein